MVETAGDAGANATTSTDEALPLFRAEALAGQDEKWLGEVIFARPLAFRLMALFSIAVTLAAALLGYFGTYTKKSTVTGEIMPEAGVVRAYAPFPGYVTKVNATEGKHVTRGDILFVVSSERMSERGDMLASQTADYSAIKKLLNGEIAATQSLQAKDRQRQQQTVSALTQRLRIGDQMIEMQKQRVQIAAAIEQKYRNLFAQSYLSEAQYDAKRAELLDQQSRLASLEDSRTDQLRELNSARIDLDQLADKSNNALADIRRAYHTTDTSLAESESRREVAIVASVSGTATVINTHLGETVDPSKSLVAIVPDGSKFHALLYVTSKDIGIVSVGDTVKLRYEAYPYAHYGMATGKVKSVSESALAPNEMSELGEMVLQRIGPEDRGAPLYCITVSLDEQHVSLGGRRFELRPHMILQADVIQDTRRLYQWFLEPLYALRQR